MFIWLHFPLLNHSPIIYYLGYAAFQKWYCIILVFDKSGFSATFAESKKLGDMNVQNVCHVISFSSHIYVYTHTRTHTHTYIYIYYSALKTLKFWGENFDPQILSWAHVTGSSTTCIMVTLPLPFSEVLADQLYPTSPFWRRSALGFLWKEWC